ncbi:uncharacterized protein LOC111406279 isoform X2 [Olea europaea var. sylvestris]|uniref:uncharacterized protein LOC111406279 isoform X2 n=1 Tax=Olea europaea var. sylvestris TaxID=158386 RepID=UPI000C1D7E45|nr:uncharacterized protein LOC111406279 isoform X2 [Olea europaea var. sylvestris]
MEDAPTPARRITRSITVLIESKERDSPLKEVLKTPAHNEKGEKRPPGNVEEEDGDAVDPEKLFIHHPPGESIRWNYQCLLQERCDFNTEGQIEQYAERDVQKFLFWALPPDERNADTSNYS